MIKPVIIAGGTGSRLWPLSRKYFPKQFLKITSENTLLQDTLLRLNGLDVMEATLICNELHRFIIAEQLREISMSGKILLEPFGRNTAPAIALAALKEVESGNDPLLLVLSADHSIENLDTFKHSISHGEKIANDGYLVTFGVLPTSPETGFGYIKCGVNIDNGFLVESFVEKPSIDVAKQYLSTGDYYWNSGMFIFKASRYLEELKKFNPKIYDVCKKSLEFSKIDNDFIRVNEKYFTNCPNESIDYSVMEHTDFAAVVPLDAKWNDIGSFSAIWDISDKDVNGNVIKGDVFSESSFNNLIIAKNRIVTTVGMENTIVIETKDAVLVANKNNVQDVKKIVQQLKDAGRSETDNHRQVYRPWGYYDSIDIGSRDQVKRITVNPGAKLSTQLHHHRSEHWVVVTGTAKVTNGDNIFFVRENESTFIPIGQVHSLENPGILPLELIEVQVGDYLGEDDIVRLNDIYGRL